MPIANFDTFKEHLGRSLQSVERKEDDQSVGHVQDDATNEDMTISSVFRDGTQRSAAYGLDKSRPCSIPTARPRIYY